MVGEAAGEREPWRANRFCSFHFREGQDRDSRRSRARYITNSHSICRGSDWSEALQVSGGFAPLPPRPVLCNRAREGEREKAHKTNASARALGMA